MKEQKLCTKFLKNQTQLEGAHITWNKLNLQMDHSIICIQDSYGQIYQKIGMMKTFPIIEQDAKNLIPKEEIQQIWECSQGSYQICTYESRIIVFFDNRNKLIIKRGTKQIRSIKLTENLQIVGMGLSKDKIIVLSYRNNTLDFLSISISNNQNKHTRILGVVNNFLHNKQRVVFQSSYDGKYFFFNNALYSIQEGFKSVFTSRCYYLQFNKDSTQIAIYRYNRVIIYELKTFKEILVLNYAPLMENIWDKHYYFDFDNQKLYVNNWYLKSEYIFYKQ